MNVFYIVIIWEGAGFMWKITFGISIESTRFENPWVRKKSFYESVCLYWIGLKFGTPFEGLKRKDEFDNQPVFTSGSGFIHKKCFLLKKKKFHIPTKIYEIWKKCWGIKFLTLKRSTNSLVTIFWKELYILFINEKIY